MFSRFLSKSRSAPQCVQRRWANSSAARKRMIIIGAAGRDFHNFNMVYRDNDDYEVVAFTAAQIPGIDGRKYPPILAGKLYPEGIPIEDESNLEAMINEGGVEEAVFCYSDVSHATVMHLACRTMAAGADFKLLGWRQTEVESIKPVISVLASRTGCGKSQTSRSIVKTLLEDKGMRVVAIRHPMPYGDLSKQICQRFASYEDLDKHECTIEEREEYEPYVDMGAVIYSGVDYEKILREAEKEADVILWDGGNNDMGFIKPDIEVCVVDPHRPGHEMQYFPGEVNVRNANIIVVNKVDTADMHSIFEVRENCAQMNPKAVICEAASPIDVDDASMIKDKRALVVEDGPTLTHGGMKYGAGYVAAKRMRAKEIIDPRPFIKGSIVDTFKAYPHTTDVLPAMGYSDEQIKDLQDSINSSDAEVVVTGTPIDLTRILKVDKPMVRARYSLQCVGQPDLFEVLEEKLDAVIAQKL